MGCPSGDMRNGESKWRGMHIVIFKGEIRSDQTKILLEIRSITCVNGAIFGSVQNTKQHVKNMIKFNDHFSRQTWYWRWIFKVPSLTRQLCRPARSKNSIFTSWIKSCHNVMYLRSSNACIPQSIRLCLSEMERLSATKIAMTEFPRLVVIAMTARHNILYVLNNTNMFVVQIVRFSSPVGHLCWYECRTIINKCAYSVLTSSAYWYLLIKQTARMRTFFRWDLGGYSSNDSEANPLTNTLQSHLDIWHEGWNRYWRTEISVNQCIAFLAR